MLRDVQKCINDGAQSIVFVQLQEDASLLQRVKDMFDYR